MNTFASLMTNSFKQKAVCVCLFVVSRYFNFVVSLNHFKKLIVFKTVLQISKDN